MSAAELRALILHVASAGGSRLDLGDWEGRAPVLGEPVVELPTNLVAIVIGALGSMLGLAVLAVEFSLRGSERT
jgi:hypothetical protein